MGSLDTTSLFYSRFVGIRCNGRKGYQFVFQNTSVCLYRSSPSRGYKVIEEVFGEEFPSVWVSDRYNAPLKTPRAQHGMKRVDTIASIIETAKRQGKNALDVLTGSIQLFPAESSIPTQA